MSRRMLGRRDRFSGGSLMGRHECARRWMALTVLAAFLVTGCGRTASTPVPGTDLDPEYLTVESGDACRVLLLREGGDFAILERERDAWCDRAMRPDPAPVATGVWTFAEGRLELDGSGWTVVFEPDSTRVQIMDRADTLGSLRWVTATGAPPLSACDLVSAAQFDEFLHPTEGSGSAGG